MSSAYKLDLSSRIQQRASHMANSFAVVLLVQIRVALLNRDTLAQPFLLQLCMHVASEYLVDPRARAMLSEAETLTLFSINPVPLGLSL